MSMEKVMFGDLRLSRLRAASEWLLRMEDASRTDADIDEWLRWCAEDPENLTEFQRVQGDWQDLDALGSDAKAQSPPEASMRAELLSGDAPQPSVAPEKARREALPARQAHQWKWGARAALAAAACACAIALAVLWVRDRPPSVRVPRQLVATEMNRAATLPDGSRVILRPASTLLVDYVPQQRNLDLLAGEAFFTVKHDKRHPFIVRAGDMRVMAVGTAFDVRREDGRMTVTVEEGIVKVTDEAWSSKGLPATWRVAAGYRFSYSSERRAEMVARADVTSALRWRDGELAYVREPLGSVVEDLNRYSPHRIVIEDPVIATLPFTGTAFTSSLRDWLKGIQQAYPVRVEEAANGDLILTSRRRSRTAASVP